MDTSFNSLVSAKDLEENQDENEEVKESNEKFLSQIKMRKSSKVPHYSDEKLRSLDKSVLENQLKILEERKSAQKKESVNVGLLMDYMHRVYF